MQNLLVHCIGGEGGEVGVLVIASRVSSLHDSLWIRFRFGIQLDKSDSVASPKLTTETHRVGLHCRITLQDCTA